MGLLSSLWSGVKNFGKALIGLPSSTPTPTIGGSLGSIVNSNAGSAAGAALAYKGVQETNAQNQTNAREAMSHNTLENSKARSFNSAQALLQRDWASNQAETNRNFQADQSNTAVRRRMADMEAGGINPILAASYDASTPGGSTVSGAVSGSSPSGGGTSSTAVDPMTSAFSGAHQALSLKQAAENINLTRAQTARTQAGADIQQNSLSIWDMVKEGLGGLRDIFENSVERMGRGNQQDIIDQGLGESNSNTQDPLNITITHGRN